MTDCWNNCSQPLVNDDSKQRLPRSTGYVQHHLRLVRSNLFNVASLTDPLESSVKVFAPAEPVRSLHYPHQRCYRNVVKGSYTSAAPDREFGQPKLVLSNVPTDPFTALIKPPLSSF